MTGTEKQITYAMDILNKINLRAEEELAAGEKAIAERAAEGKSSRFGMAKKKNAEKVINAISTVKDSEINASVIINVLSSYESIIDHLDIYDGNVEKMIKYTI